MNTIAEKNILITGILKLRDRLKTCPESELYEYLDRLDILQQRLNQVVQIELELIQLNQPIRSLPC